MENTQLIDASLILLALVGGWLLAQKLFRASEVAVRRLPLFIVNAAALWCLLNWITHTLAVLIVNVQRMMAGAWTYTFHFYALILMGITFTALTFFQLNRIRLLSRGEHHLFRQLTLVSWGIMLLSLPIFPLNPIGLLPVLSSSIILVTMAATKIQWRSTIFSEHSKIERSKNFVSA